ncbi:MAG: 2'-5' RNA ligase family protein [Saprospiraceae bacterium]|nr:2'-5' RNA ligase family protein [Saprospiraceae bacterium]
MKDPIFFLAILPPSEIAEEVTGFKKYAAQQFKSSHALKSPPHVTIFPPFRWNESELYKLEKQIKFVASKTETFYVQLENFACFSPRVIFIDVLKSDDLTRLYKSLKIRFLQELDLSDKSPHPFTPHMTVAFKDLKRPYFLRAWAHFSQTRYLRIFRTEELVLLKHNGQQWDIFRSYPFKK